MRSNLGIISGLGIICGRGSCGAVQISVPVRHWNLKNLTRDISLDHSRYFPPAQYFRMALLLFLKLRVIYTFYSCNTAVSNWCHIFKTCLQSKAIFVFGSKLSSRFVSFRFVSKQRKTSNAVEMFSSIF